MKVAIIKYNAGNVKSVEIALARLGISAVLTDDPAEILSSDKIIFPGVGEASSAMEYLKTHHLDKVILNATQPFLGICLGMQLMCTHSAENDTECLGIFKEKVFQFDVNTIHLKSPQIGWNNIYHLKTSLFKGVPENSYCYFVHGYFATLGAQTIATTEYGLEYSAALNHKNYFGVQFHPEKSADTGSRIIQNFLEL
jgi:glutamine amidotransferase